MHFRSCLFVNYFKLLKSYLIKYFFAGNNFCPKYEKIISKLPNLCKFENF